MPARRSIFRVLVDFTSKTRINHHSWVFVKKDFPDSDRLVAGISRALSAFIRENVAFFNTWDRIVIYYDNGQKELTNIVNIEPLSAPQIPTDCGLVASERVRKPLSN